MTRTTISGKELNALGAGLQPDALLTEHRPRRNLRSKAVKIAISPSLEPTPSPPSDRNLVEATPNIILKLFSFFPHLPTLVRRMILTMAIPRRVVVLHFESKNKRFVTEEPNISLLSVSKEARECALQIVLSSFCSQGDARTIFVDVEQDTIFLDAGRDNDIGQSLLQWHGVLTPQHFRKVERLDIGVYEGRKDYVLDCIKTLGKTFLLDQAYLGLPFTQIRLLAHTPFSCYLKRHTAQIFLVDCEDQVTVEWEDDMVAKVKEVNKSVLDIARHYWGYDGSPTYKNGVEGPISLEFLYGFCGLQGTVR